MDMQALCEAGAATLRGIIPRAYGWPVPDAEAPFVTVTPGDWEPRIVFQRSPRIPMKVRVMAGNADRRGTVDALYAYMGTGPLSLIAAIEDATAWAGGADSVMVTTVGEPQLYEFGGRSLLGFEMTVDVIAATS